MQISSSILAILFTPCPNSLLSKSFPIKVVLVARRIVKSILGIFGYDNLEKRQNKMRGSLMNICPSKALGATLK